MSDTREPGRGNFEDATRREQASAEMRQAVAAALVVQRELYTLWGRWPTFDDVCLYVEGRPRPPA